METKRSKRTRTRGSGLAWSCSVIRRRRAAILTHSLSDLELTMLDAHLETCSTCLRYLANRIAKPLPARAREIALERGSDVSAASLRHLVVIDGGRSSSRSSGLPPRHYSFGPTVGDTELVAHSYEACRSGKPDQREAELSNLIGSYFLSLDPEARFDLRVSGSYVGDPNREDGHHLVDVSGEVSRHLLVDHEESVNREVEEIILNHCSRIDCTLLTSKEITVRCDLRPQDTKLERNAKGHNVGDSGETVAVAFANTPIMLPWERYIAHELRCLFDDIFRSGGRVPLAVAKRSGIPRLDGLRSDGKMSVTALYQGVKLHSLKHISVALQHAPELPVKELRDSAKRIICAYLANCEESEESHGVSFGLPSITVNGNGAFNRGGWLVDQGVRDAKPQAAFFSTWGVAEDSPYGEDPSKPSGIATVLARYLATEVVRNRLAEASRVHLTYAIGTEDQHPENFGLNVSTMGTARCSQEEIHRFVVGLLPSTMAEAAAKLGYGSAESFRKVAERGDLFHGDFRWNGFPWGGGLHPEERELPAVVAGSAGSESGPPRRGGVEYPRNGTAG